MSAYSEAYLDIETTGLAPEEGAVTVIGIYLVNSTKNRLVQLVGREITPHSLLEVLDGVNTIYTYNGSRFDLPFIRDSVGVDLVSRGYAHIDLMPICLRNNLKGGFKMVEKLLGIERETAGLDGFDAVKLWRSYCEYDDEEALELLLKYNGEDTVNLKFVRENLEKLLDSSQS